MTNSNYQTKLKNFLLKEESKPISQKTYDQFLKANSQHAGLKSYNAMVAFLIQTPIQVKAYKHL